MRRRVLLVVIFSAMASLSARAEHIDTVFTQAFFGNLSLGKGARTWGMGGTGLAIAGDPEATSWNPAALAGVSRPWFTFSFANENLDRLPSQFDVVGIPPYGSGVVGTVTESSVSASGTGLEYLAFAYPFRVSNFDIVGQVSYQRRVSYSFDLTYAYEYRHQNPNVYDYRYVYDTAASGGIDILTFSVASELTSWARIGVNIHRWFNGFSIPVHETHDKSYWTWDEPWTEVLNDELTFDLSGFSLDVGAQFSVREWLSVGLVYRPGFEASLKYANDADFSSSRTGESFSGSHQGRGVINFPDSFGIGIVVSPVEKLAAGFDVVGTLWSEARIEGYSRATSRGDIPAPKTYMFPTMERPDLWSQKDTAQLHTGAEYALTVKSFDIPLRFGIFHEELLAHDGDGEVQYSTGITLGFGVRWHGLAFDLAWVRNDAKNRYEKRSLRASIRYAFK